MDGSTNINNQYSGENVGLIEFKHGDMQMVALYNTSRYTKDEVNAALAVKTMEDHPYIAIMTAEHYANICDKNSKIMQIEFNYSGAEMVVLHNESKFTEYELEEIIVGFETCGAYETSNPHVAMNTVVMTKKRLRSIFGTANQTMLPKGPDREIEELELSVRSLNCLKRDGVNTLYKLLTKTAAEMKNIKSLGPKSVAEIISRVRDEGYDEWADAIFYDDYTIPQLITDDPSYQPIESAPSY